MWGIVPAAGLGSRMQPLAFSKELLPVGTSLRNGASRPRAVAEYVLERMIIGGVDRVCFVISPAKSDIIEYFGASYGGAELAYVVQPGPNGLCDAVFRAETVIDPAQPVVIGLPDTIWFPEGALRDLPGHELSFLLFPVERPALFDAVVLDRGNMVQEIQVKQAEPASHWVWGAFKMPGAVFAELKQLWHARGCRDEFIGTLVNAYIARGGKAYGVRSGTQYADVGTVDGYRAAINLLAARESGEPAKEPVVAETRSPLQIDPDVQGNASEFAYQTDG